MTEKIPTLDEQFSEIVRYVLREEHRSRYLAHQRRLYVAANQEFKARIDRILWANRGGYDW